MKLHIFRLSGHDFVHYRKIEIGANDRAVYQQSISCFIVYANFDWFLINLSGVCNNVRVSDACFMTLYYNEATVKEDIKLDDFYFINTVYGSTQGVICTMESEDNWKNYAALNLDVIKSPQINDGYLELHKYIRVIYEDAIGEEHTNYYKVDGSDITLLSQEEGENFFEKYRKLEKGLYVEELTIENLIELIN